MRRGLLIAYLIEKGAWLHERQPLTDVYARSPLHMAGVPRRGYLRVQMVIQICRALDIPVPLDVQRRHRPPKVRKKSKLVVDVSGDAMVVVIPRKASRTGKGGVPGRGRKRNPRS